jgi:hypothetical protein
MDVGNMVRWGSIDSGWTNCWSTRPLLGRADWRGAARRRRRGAAKLMTTFCDCFWDCFCLTDFFDAAACASLNDSPAYINAVIFFI